MLVAMKSICASLLAVVLTTLWSSPAWPQEQLLTPADAEFFEQKIRPVLIKHCYECHSAEAAQAHRLKGGLLLDSRTGLRAGGDSGPAISADRPQESLLLQALRYESVEMPPRGKLPANVIADFEQWVARGAPDPRREATAKPPARQIDLDAGRQHWAYRPIQRPRIPVTAANPDQLRSPIDVFITAKLQEQRIEPSAAAERETLIRRLSFDLLGLPPEQETVTEFLADQHPDAWERLIDEMLASPHFGLRWGRHWLSVARFGESLTLRGFLLPEAWRYRDYVIDAFNADRPFDRFIVEQIAGDLLSAESLEERQRQLIATSFLVLGNLNLEEQDKPQLRMDVVDEQLEAIGKGFLAQTIGCARCHDHKFDPIPTRDYYALAGILANAKTLEHANISKWFELPLPVDDELEAVLSRHEAAIAASETRIAEVKKELQQFEAAVVLAAKDLPGIVIDDGQAKVVGDWERSQSVKPYIGDGYLHDKSAGKGQKTITFQPDLPAAGRYEVRLAYTPADNRSTAAPVTIFSADGETTIAVNQRQRPAIDGVFVPLGTYRFELNGQGYVIVSTEGTSDHVVVDAVQFLPVDATEETAFDPPADALAVEESAANVKARLTQQLTSLQQDLKRLQSNGPKRPKYMTVKEESEISDLKIHIRGTVHTLGETAPRGFLQVVTTELPATVPSDQSGRRELGEWIASPTNPLTSRVISNRIWHWLFGAGLTRTPDNFGTTGDAPSHPELLDFLSVRLMDRDWSVKSTVREIVQSHSYRRTSLGAEAQLNADPENRWLSHQNRRRLDAECLLDAILTASGQRDDRLGGSTIRPGTTEDYGYEHRSRRRAVYWPVFRNALPEIFEVFDFADPSVTAGGRNVSTVAPQALFFLNDEWVKSEARLAARRLLAESQPDDAARIRQAFRLILGRSHSSTESQLADRSLIQQDSPADAWAALVQALFASIDFRYVE